MGLQCHKCGYKQVRLFKTKFLNNTWHVRAVCSKCKRYRYVNKKLYFTENMDEIKTKKMIKAEQELVQLMLL